MNRTVSMMAFCMIVGSAGSALADEGARPQKIIMSKGTFVAGVKNGQRFVKQTIVERIPWQEGGGTKSTIRGKIGGRYFHVVETETPAPVTGEYGGSTLIKRTGTVNGEEFRFVGIKHFVPNSLGGGKTPPIPLEGKDVETP